MTIAPLLRRSSVLLLLAAAACADHPTAPDSGPAPPPPVEPPRPVGVYRIEVHGIGAEEMRSSIAATPRDGDGGASLALNPAGNGLVFEQVSSLSFTEGTRTAGGQRYVSFTYRVRNGTGVPLNNLTLLMVTRANTIPGTPLSSLRRFDGVAADPAIASRVVPTGAVALGRDLVEMRAVYADVVQVISEDEVSAITPPAGVTGIFPYGYVVRNAASQSTRALPATADANRFDGVVTVSFRLPLQPTGAQDVFSLFFEILAVDDTQVRVTESIEEQGVEARAQVAAAAAALGATQVTTLAGSASAGYPGQRQICLVRTAGTAGAPARFITTPGAYTRLALFRAGESPSTCAPEFRTGTAAPVGVGVPTALTARAMDRYGNVLTAIVDSVAITSTDAGMTGGARTALAGGAAAFTLGFSGYGTPALTATGRRLKSTRALAVVPISRTWTGAVSTNWATPGNWNVGAVPASLDTAVVPAGTPFQPSLTGHVTIGGVGVADAATVSLGGFDLAASGDVLTGQTGGGITGTTGVVRLVGSGAVAGRLPEAVVTGTYALTGNLLLKTPATVDGGGGLESVGWMTEIRHY